MWMLIILGLSWEIRIELLWMLLILLIAGIDKLIVPIPIPIDNPNPWIKRKRYIKVKHGCLHYRIF